jgi:hypothetical protein
MFRETFENLDNWRWEGGGKAFIVEPGVLRLDCAGSRQGGVGCMIFCRKDFPDRIAVEYDLLVRQSNGLVITFVAMRGLKGEDALTDLPPRAGIFGDYVGVAAAMRSYHVSVSRYGDDGVHSGVSNWRRNPGLHLMAQGQDLCKEIGRRYAIRIEKDGPRCALFVDGQPGPAFTDPGQLPDEIPTAGKIGFRAIGARVIADISNFRVVRMGSGTG